MRILSVLLSTDIGVSLHVFRTEIPFYFLFYAISQNRNIMHEQFVQSLIGMFVAGAVIGSLYGTTFVLLGQQARAESLTSGYYTLGSFLAAVLAIILFLGKSKIFESKRWVWFGLVLVITVGLILTLNRIHWVIMVLLFISIGIIQERKLLIAAIVLLGCLLWLSPSIRNRFDQTIHFKENLSGRDVIWKGAAMIWSNHPVLGYGPATFKKVFPIQKELEDTNVGGWHNDYIQIYIESGFLGLMTFLWLIYTIYSQVFIKYRKMKSSKENKRILLALAASMGTIFISSTTGSGFLDILIRILFVILLAMTSLLMQVEEGDAVNQLQKTNAH